MRSTSRQTGEVEFFACTLEFESFLGLRSPESDSMCRGGCTAKCEGMDNERDRLEGTGGLQR